MAWNEFVPWTALAMSSHSFHISQKSASAGGGSCNGVLNPFEERVAF